VTRNCITVVALDGTVSVASLAAEVELEHRVGDLISDGADGHWRVEEIVFAERCLVVAQVMPEEPHVALPELLAA